MIDWDRAETSWYLVDLGTMVFHAHFNGYDMDTCASEEQEQELEQFKEWLLDAYEWPTTREELT